jgi:hypothetical protein
MTVYLGGNRVATSQDNDGGNMLHVAFATGLNRSEHNASFEGIPICLFDHPDGGYALGIAQIPSNEVDNEHRYTVWQGFRYALRTRSNVPGHALLYHSVSGTSKAASTVLYGHHIAINSDDALIAVKVSVPLDDITYAYLGGVPILCVRVDGRWYLGMCDANG